MRRFLVLVLLLCCFASPSLAVDDDVDDSWHFKVTPYLVTASLDGKVGIGPVVTNIAG